jgi:hypothetical protein
MYPLICTDCRWCIPTAAANRGVYQCKASEKTQIDLVTGKTTTDYQFCSVMRMSHELCGNDGKLFSLNIPDQEENTHGE